MARELGLNPRTLIKNIPSPTQQWKLPVKQWIQELYEKRTEKYLRKNAGVLPKNKREVRIAE